MGVPGSQESLGDLEYFPRVVTQSAGEVASELTHVWGGGEQAKLLLTPQREVLVFMPDG